MKKNLQFLLSLFAILILPLLTHAQILATISSSGTGSSNVSSISITSLSSTGLTGSGGGPFSGWSTSSTFDGTTFLSFNLTPSSGSFNITGININLARNNNQGPIDFRVTYQIGAGVETIYSSATVANNASSVNLSSSTVISNINSMIVFRIYGWNAVNSGNSSISFTSGNVLPINITSFTPTQVGNTIVLKWETASEKDNDYMEVQRSKDGIHFIPLKQIKGHGTTSEPQHYDWVDTRPLSGTNYYRLKQVDYDGKYEYHKIESIEFKGKTADPGLQLYPTEVKDVLTVVLDAPTTDDASLLVVDALGRVVQRHRLAIGSTLEAVQLSALPRGQYFITLQSGNSLQTARFMKM